MFQRFRMLIIVAKYNHQKRRYQYLREVESRPPPPVIGDCVNRRDVQLSVEGL